MGREAEVLNEAPGLQTRGAGSAASLTSRTIGGVFWSTLSMLLNRGGRFLTTLILARLLMPEDFGLIAIGSLIVDLAALLSDVGLGAALIQKKDLDPSHLTTCFWFNMALGLSLFGVMWCLAPWAVRFFRHEAVLGVVRGLALNLVLAPIGSIQWVLLNRELQFKVLMLSQTIATIVRVALSLLLAFAGYGYWSLVWGPIAGTIAGTIANWRFCAWRPGWSFALGRFWELFRFGRSVLGEKILGHIAGQADQLIAGRFLGMTTLGYYHFAYSLPHLAQTHLAPVVTRVLFPILSQTQDEPERFHRGYLKSLQGIAVITFPFAVGLGITAPEFIRVVFGAKWQSVILPMQILCLSGFLQSISTVAVTVQQAKGRPDIGFWWSLVTIPFLILALVLAAPLGLSGIAWTMLILNTVCAVTFQAITNRLIHLPWRTLLGELAPCVSSGIGMALIVSGWKLCAQGWLARADGWLLTSEVVLGAVSYLLLLRWQAASIWRELVGQLRHRLVLAHP